uniref:Flavanone 3-dioxygenase 2 n=1 Tax=Elaeis guineensis var. tenera TaxID=51953 RepID=A0A6J0PF95_ELAGV|nr:flavanone 3-dioxygenase 2 [Elaeis guineensis]
MADQLLSTGPPRRTLPERYIRPESQRPRLTAVESDANIPVIDLSADDLSQIISQIRDACQYYGFFQIVNHGMPTGSMVEMKAIAREFFSLPPEEKAKLYLRLHCYPLEDFVPGWPSKPPSFSWLRLVQSLSPEDKSSASGLRERLRRAQRFGARNYRCYRLTMLVSR